MRGFASSSTREIIVTTCLAHGLRESGYYRVGCSSHLLLGRRVRRSQMSRVLKVPVSKSRIYLAQSRDFIVTVSRKSGQGQGRHLRMAERQRISPLPLYCMLKLTSMLTNEKIGLFNQINFGLFLSISGHVWRFI